MTASAPLTAPAPDPMARLADLVWGRLPRSASRLSPALGSSLSDSAFLARWPAAGVVAAPLAFALGALLGATQWGSRNVYSSSVGVTAGLLAIAVLFGAGVGAWITVGYAVTDFTVGARPDVYTADLAAGVGLRLGLLVSYLALALLLVGVPLLASQARRRLLDRTHNAALAGVGQVVVGAAFALAWSAASPIYLRSMWVWSGGSPPVSAIEPVQTNGPAFALLAAVAGVGRSVLAELSPDPPFTASPALLDRLPPLTASIVRALLSAALFTLLLAGLADTWADLALLFGLMLVASVLRFVVLARITGYVRLVSKVPPLVRIAVTLLIGAGLATVLLSPVYRAEADALSFRPLLLSIGLTMVLGAVLLPDTGVRRSADR